VSLQLLYGEIAVKKVEVFKLLVGQSFWNILTGIKYSKYVHAIGLDAICDGYPSLDHQHTDCIPQTLSWRSPFGHGCQHLALSPNFTDDPDSCVRIELSNKCIYFNKIIFGERAKYDPATDHEKLSIVRHALLQRGQIL